MNDVDFGGDLRTALHRDADLVGEPSADLLDQLVRRRSHQRNTRAALIGAVAAVVVIAAGIPVGASFLTRSDGGPATQTVEPTPSAESSSSPTLPSTSVTPSDTTMVAPPAASDTTETEATPPAAEDAAPPCPDAAGFREALLAAGVVGPDGVEVNPAAPAPQCSGSWAYAVLTSVEPDGDVIHRLNWTTLFRFVDGAWVPVDRGAYCAAGQVPADIEYIPCETD
jgi:hypothetical protein